MLAPRTGSLYGFGMVPPPVPNFPNACGGCTLCCKVMAIVELAKPEGAWCRHCAKGRGCSAYADRPTGCHEFACAWLVTVQEGVPTDPAMRPDRCRVVFHEPAAAPGNMVAHVDPAYPDAWRKGVAMHRIADLAAGGATVTIHDGRRHLVVTRDGIHEASVVGRLPDGGLELARGRRIGRVA